MTIDLEALYVDLHRHPELSFQETRTAGIAAQHLRELGIEITEGVGRTGVVGVLANGPGPVVWVRADMDALPVREDSGLAYASTVVGTDAEGNSVPVMHACGHDMHVTAMIGAVERLVGTTDEWSGTVVVIIQPAEEFGAGARAMLDDGMLARFPKPDIVLGQHVTPLPAGQVGLRPGPQMSASDGLTVTLHGRGGHGSRPHSTVDPVVMAAATIMRLQTVVSREMDPHDLTVVSVGAVHAGTKNNIIPPHATLELSLRYPDDALREKVLAAVERVIRAEAMASGATQEPTIETLHTLPATINDTAAAARVTAAFRDAFGIDNVVDPGLYAGSEDVSWFARDAEVPLVFWFWGGIDPELYAHAVANDSVAEDVPSTHAPAFAPVIHPTIEVGVTAMATAARTFLG
ncbi:M20 family metallopeptidase [Microbacterium pseudoresistens]|uniref:Hippurate hydrolase n=1 Tax=Microbacterium pseudoresistens TaxID=640634 RepID=A0A7Y9EU04_9MICO|nr:amidohydrolase [Microbacterium pseudoresistens]NYD53831.1 hippurate hydrolase [Microbacterium pseudoresistens]